MTAATRICIITPGALASNPRVVKEAQALSEVGFDVTVISTRTLSFVDILDQDVLSEACWRAQRLDFRSRWRWRVRRLRQAALAKGFGATGWAPFADLGFSSFTGGLIAAAKRIKADLYIAHYPAALPAAAIAASKHNAPFAFDAEDFHLGDFPEETAYELERRMVQAIEGRYLPRCSYVTAASPGMADAYADAYKIARPTVVLNVFPRCRAPVTPTARGTAEPRPSVYWFSQTIGPGRGLECAVQAIGRARSQPHLHLRGTPANGYRERLHELALQVGVADRVHFEPPAPPSEMELLAAAYDVGLVGESGHTASRQVALTNKQFTYLLAGIPVVMSDISAHRAFASQVGAAARLYRVGDAECLAVTLDTLFGDSEALAAARAMAWKLGNERFNWETEQAALLDHVISVCRPRDERRSQRDTAAAAARGVSRK
jgi:glycosyltransferase involved in cell wall biosynthesis